MQEIIDLAINIARKAHQGQTDKVGLPYLFHSMRVMNRGYNDDERIAGILHDVVEDSDTTCNDLLQAGIPSHIVEAIDCLTHREGESYEAYVERCANNDLAKRVKMHDLTDNMDLRRLPEVTDKDLDRLNRYIKAYRYLAERSGHVVY